MADVAEYQEAAYPKLKGFIALRRLELIVLVLVVLAAFAIRIYRLGELPDTVLGDEADNVQSAVRILYGQPPDNGFFGVDWTQQPAFSVYKQAAFIAVFGFNIMALRLPSALISALALIPFYLLLRRQFSALASMLATMLLATDVWYLNFSRSGWNCIDIAFDMLMTMLLLVSALYATTSERPGQWRAPALFAAAGVFCALGLYGYPAGRAIAIGVASFFPAALDFFWKKRGAVLLGYIVLFGVAAALFAPQAWYALRNWQMFNTRTNVVVIFNNDEYKADPAGTMLRQLENNLRGPWVGSVNNTPQYSPAGEPQLDRFTGILVLIGMIMTVVMRKVREQPETWLWWLMLLAGWLSTQLITVGTPNGARGIGYMPTLIYFAAVALDGAIRLIPRLPVASRRQPTTGLLASAFVIACVVAASVFNVIHYVDWQNQPWTRQARYLYVMSREFPDWSADIVYRATHGMGVTNVGIWRDAHPIKNVANP